MAALPCAHQLTDDFGRVLQIAIHRDDGPTAREVQPREQGLLVPEVSSEGEPAESGPAGGFGFDGAPGTIGRTIVHKNDLTTAEMFKLPRERFAERGHVACFVAERNHHGEVGTG